MLTIEINDLDFAVPGEPHRITDEIDMFLIYFTFHLVEIRYFTKWDAAPNSRSRSQTWACCP